MEQDEYEPNAKWWDSGETALKVKRKVPFEACFGTSNTSDLAWCPVFGVGRWYSVEIKGKSRLR